MHGVSEHISISDLNLSVHLKHSSGVKECKADKMLFFGYLESGQECSGTVEDADEQAQGFLHQGVALGVAQVQGMPQQPPQHALKLHTSHKSVRFVCTISRILNAIHCKKVVPKSCPHALSVPLVCDMPNGSGIDIPFSGLQ